MVLFSSEIASIHTLSAMCKSENWNPDTALFAHSLLSSENHITAAATGYD